MKNKIIFLALTLLFSNAYARPVILVSSTPIASLVSMITEEAATVQTVNISGGCSHHYHARPSDRNKITNADMIIYIDDSFDSYMSTLLQNYKGIIVRLSGIDKLKKINKGNSKSNWHFWLDLDNVLLLQSAMADKIISAFPEIDQIIRSNLEKSKEKIAELKSIKQDKLKSLNEIVLLSDSMEYFFQDMNQDMNIKLTKLYQQPHGSLKYLQNLEAHLTTNVSQCLILDKSRNPQPFKRFNKTLILVDSENWQLDKESENSIQNLFLNKYLELISKVEECKKH